MSTTTTDDLSVEVRTLRRELAELRALVDERDDEALVLETIVEFLVDRESTQRSVLGRVVMSLCGDNDKWGGADMLDQLYDGDRHEVGFRQARGVRWNWRPARRWRQFGSRAELIHLAEALDVPIKRRSSREWLIRDIWKHAPDALKGGGVLHR